MAFTRVLFLVLIWCSLTVPFIESATLQRRSHQDSVGGSLVRREVKTDKQPAPEATASSASAKGKGILYAMNNPGNVDELHVALACLEKAGVPDDVAIRIECQDCGLPEHVLGNVTAEFAKRIYIAPENETADIADRKWTLTKAVAGWSSPFEKTLIMDTDTCVESKATLAHIFDVLNDFDFASAWECCALPQDKALYGTGYEPQTGVMGVRSSAAQLLRDWHSEYFANEEHYKQFSSTDQQAMLKVLMSKKYSFYPLPVLFNYREFTVPTSNSVPGAYGKDPFIVHSHSLSSPESATDIVKEVNDAKFPDDR